MAITPDKDALRGIDPFKELRMVLAIGQQPDVFICVDGKPVGPCVNVNVSESSLLVDVSGEYEATRTITVSGIMLRLPSGLEFYAPYSHPQSVGAGDMITTNGAIRIEAN
jgi:hypothetical protein